MRHLFKILFLLLIPSVSLAQVRVFPTAQGHARFATNWRSATQICVVNTFADNATAPVTIGGELKGGSLRGCLETMTGNRLVIFSQGGNYALTDSIVVSSGSVRIAGDHNNVLISCKGINMDTSTKFGQAFGRCIARNRRPSSEHFYMSNIWLYQGSNTATPRNSAALNQGGGAFVIEESDNTYFRNVSFGSSNDETVTLQGTTSSGGDGYANNTTFHDVLFTHPNTDFHFAAHTICVVASSMTADVPSLGETMGITFFRVGFVAGNRGFENKCYEVSAANIIQVGGGQALNGMLTKGGVKIDVESSIFKGAQGESGAPITMESFSAHNDRGNLGINGTPDYYLSDIVSPSEVFLTNSAIFFKTGNVPIKPQPTPRPARARIGVIQTSAILPTSQLEASMLSGGDGTIGNSFRRGCDGGKIIRHTKIDRIALNELRAGASRTVKTEKDLGGFISPANTTVCPGVIDGDFDGMPTEWENQYSCVDANVSDWRLDPDNDGYLNYEEYLNGTNPCVADSP